MLLAPGARLAEAPIESGADRAPLYDLVAHAHAAGGPGRVRKTRALCPDPPSQIAQELRFEGDGLLTAQSTPGDGREWIALAREATLGSGCLLCTDQVC